jgi:hypothetical protein
MLYVPRPGRTFTRGARRMRKRLNVRLLLWTVAVLLGLCAGVHFLHEAQAQDNAGSLLRQADSAAARKDHARAVVYFSHYLAYAPDDVGALDRYARSLEQLPPESPCAWVGSRTPPGTCKP